MAYTDFTWERIKDEFGYDNLLDTLFPELPPVQPSTTLVEALRRTDKQFMRNEKAKSEGYITPILYELAEIQQDYFMINWTICLKYWACSTTF
jgi:hypothetical protein